MSHTTLSQTVHKALREAGYIPAEIQKAGFTVAAERDGSITISHSPTCDLEHTQKYEVVLKEWTMLKVKLVQITGEIYQLSVREHLV